MKRLGSVFNEIVDRISRIVERLDTELYSKYMRFAYIGGCIVVIFFLIAYPYTQARTPEKNIDLSGEWRISLEDRPEFAEPGFDDSSWDTVNMPSSFMPYAEKKGRYEGICWLRKKIVLPENLKNGDLGLCIGRIGNADETFVNGVRVGGMGGFPPNDFTMWNHPRNYPVAAHDVRMDGENVIAVRISYLGIGEILGRMFATDRASFEKYRVASTFTQINIGYISIAMGGALLLIFLFFYLKRSEYDEYFYYCLQLNFGLPVVLSICTYWPVFGNVHTNLIVLAFAWVALNVAHPIFLHKIYRLDRPRMEKMLWFYLALVVVIGILTSTRGNVRFQGTFLIVITTSIGFYNFACNVTAILKRSPYAKIFSFFGITVVSCAIHDGFAYLAKFSGYEISFFGYQPTMMVFHIGAIFLYTGTALVLVTRFIDVADEVSNLNVTLENFIMENTMLNEKIEKLLKKKPETAMSTIAEEKIKNAIKYVNENYLQEITREDLAGYVGVHPDSLGKQFKKYTGFKLGDYINELRVNEAARRLRDEDTNIIDIAFDVGFESVRTFNRIFPKFMNETPNNYRKIFQGGKDENGLD
jgi:AraC-like DNA-binding protein